MIRKILTVSLFVFLVGCSNQNEEALETLEMIEQAYEKNESIKNGTFERINLAGTDEESIEQKSSGAFINNGEEESTWYSKTIINTSNENEYMERAKIDNEIYQRSVVASEEFPWQKMEYVEGQDTLFEMTALIDYEELEYVDSIEIKEVDDMTHYTVSFTEERSNHIVEDNVKALEEDIENQKKIGTPDEVIERMEMRIEEVKETVFSDMVNTYVINQEGYLVESHYEFTQTAPDGPALSSKTSIKLLDYNLENTDGLIPEI